MKTFIISLIYCFTPVLNVSAGGDWQVNKDFENNVTFYSSTTMLDFEGSTKNVDGYIYWEGDSLFKTNNEIYFEVDLSSFNTGIGKRDSDMRNDVLHTRKYPFSKFKGTFSSVEKTDAGYNVIASGTLSLHGVEKPVEIPGQIEINNNKMNVLSTFTILLKDYNIEAPSLMAFIKVAQEIKININLSLTNKSL
ncbi:MAG: YceI family protein [Calditrichae bacterium]|nr:YceI family protein [Calditrichia bacterium]